MSNPPCPACGSTKAGKRPGGHFKCSRCGGLFDSAPNEGGDFGNQPEQRMMREESTFTRAEMKLLKRIGKAQQ